MIITQIIQHIKSDALSVGKAANEETIVVPRYGLPYKSIPLISKELQQRADQIIQAAEDRLSGVGGGSGGGLTPEQLEKLDGIEDGAQKNPSFKTVNGNKITGEGDIEIPSGITQAQFNEAIDPILEAQQALALEMTFKETKGQAYSKTETLTTSEIEAKIRAAVQDAQIGGDTETLTQQILEIVRQKIEAGEVEFNADTRYFSAEELGLHPWESIPKGRGIEWTLEQYQQAYENAQKISDAIKLASDENRNRCVFQKGNYPVVSNRQAREVLATDVETGKGGFIICPRGITDLEFNLGGGTIFTLWNSDARQPYDERESADTVNWSGRVLSFPDSRNVTVTNGHILGDMYYRTYNNPDERLVEHGSAFFISPNTRGFKIKKMKLSGFRGDGISGSPRGYTLYDQNSMTWSKGGIDKTTGAEIEKTDSYRTPLLSLVGKTIYDNALQLMTSGFTRIANFREMFVDVFWYDKDNKLIWKEAVTQCEDFYIPAGATGVRLVCNHDERQLKTNNFGHIVLNIKALITDTTATATKFEVGDWVGGGLDDSGIEASKQDHFRTQAFDFSQLIISDNKITPQFNGYFADLYFYDANDVFVSKVANATTSPVDIPDGASKVRFVIDVSKITFYFLYLVTGTSGAITLEDVEIFYCMRGAISNCSNGFIGNNLKLHSNGKSVAKFGDPPYLDATCYAINFEDAFLRRVKITNSDIRDCWKPFIFLTQEVEMYGNTFSNCESPATIHSTLVANIHDNTWYNCGLSFTWSGGTSSANPRIANIHDNIVTGNGNSLWEMNAQYPHVISHFKNYIRGNRVKLTGDGVLSKDNTYDRLRTESVSAVIVKGLREFNDTILNEVGEGNRYVCLHEAKRVKRGSNKVKWDVGGSNSAIMLNVATPAANSDYVESKPIYYTPMIVEAKQRKKLLLVSRAHDSFIDSHDFYDSCLTNIDLSVGSDGGSNRTYNDIEVVINKTDLIDSSLYSNLKDANKETVINVKIIDTEIEFDLLDYFYDLNFATSFKALNIEFIRCKFSSEHQKDVKIVRTGSSTNITTITSKLTNCEFENVVNIDGITA